jgi:hypothetical protein
MKPYSNARNRRSRFRQGKALSMYRAMSVVLHVRFLLGDSAEKGPGEREESKEEKLCHHMFRLKKMNMMLDNVKAKVWSKQNHLLLRRPHFTPSTNARNSIASSTTSFAIVWNSSVSHHSSFLGGGVTEVMILYRVSPIVVEVTAETMLPAYTPPAPAL